MVWFPPLKTFLNVPCTFRACAILAAKNNVVFVHKNIITFGIAHRATRVFRLAVRVACSDCVINSRVIHCDSPPLQMIRCTRSKYRCTSTIFSGVSRSTSQSAGLSRFDWISLRWESVGFLPCFISSTPFQIAKKLCSRGNRKGFQKEAFRFLPSTSLCIFLSAGLLLDGLAYVFGSLTANHPANRFTKLKITRRWYSSSFSI